MPKERKTRQRKPRTDEKHALKKIRKLSPNHVVEVELLVTLEQSIVLQRIQEHLRVIRNTVLGELKKRYDQMVRTKSHKKIMRRLHRIYEQVEHTVTKEKTAAFEAEKKQLLEKLQAMQEAYRVTFAHGRLYGEMLHDTKYHGPDAVTVWSACEMAWQSIEGLLFRNAKNVYFYQRDDFLRRSLRKNYSPLRTGFHHAPWSVTLRFGSLAAEFRTITKRALISEKYHLPR